MTGIDTNVLLRYIEQDDPQQAEIAARLINELTADAPGFIALVVLVELVWALQRLYKRSRSDVLALVMRLVEARELVVEQSDLVIRAARLAHTGPDFADCLISLLSERAGCRRIVTFDHKAAKSGIMTLLA